MGIARLEEVLDGAARIEHGGMLTLEGAPNVRKRGGGQLAAQEHGDLPGNGNIARAPGAAEILKADVAVCADHLLDVGAGQADDGFFLLDEVFEDAAFQDLHGHRRGRVAGKHPGVIDRAGERPFQGPDAAADALGNKVQHFAAQGDIGIRPEFQHENVEARLISRNVHVRADAALEAVGQTIHHVGDVVGGTVTGHDDLAVRGREGVEDVEDLFLEAFFSGDVLNVIDQQNVGRAIFLAEGFLAVITRPRTHVVVHQVFGSGVEHAEVGIEPNGHVSDGVHEMRFADSGWAIHKERVGSVGLVTRVFGHILRHRHRKIIAWATDERVKRKAFLESC